MTHQPQRSTLTLGAKGEERRAKMRIPMWNHQNDLRANRGKAITVVHADGDQTDGILVDADQFTLKVKSSRTGDEVTWFKSALSGFFFPTNV